MESNVIESSVDELLDLLREKKAVNISEAAELLGLKHRELEPLISALEEKGALMVKYPVIGEAQLVIKQDAADKISIKASDIKRPKVAETLLEVKKPKVTDRAKMDITDRSTREINMRIDRVESSIEEMKSDIEQSKFRDELSEILIIINGLRDIEKISFYLREVLSLIHKMKDKGVWSSDDRVYTVTMLNNMVLNWEEFGEQEIALLFKGVRQKIETV